MDNTAPGWGLWGTGCRGAGVPERGGPGVYGKDGVTGSVVCVTTAHDQRSHHCHLVSFPKVSKC